jgi:3-dehydroquinate dehydratase
VVNGTVAGFGAVSYDVAFDAVRRLDSSKGNVVQ